MYLTLLIVPFFLSFFLFYSGFASTDGTLLISLPISAFLDLVGHKTFRFIEYLCVQINKELDALDLKTGDLIPKSILRLLKVTPFFVCYFFFGK